MHSTRNAQSSCSSGLALLEVIVGEFKRAVAAEQCYVDLKRSNSTEPIADLPRLVFDEFYSFEGTAEPRLCGPNRSPSRMGRQLTSHARQSPKIATVVVDGSPPTSLGVLGLDR